VKYPQLFTSLNTLKRFKFTSGQKPKAYDGDDVVSPDKYKRQTFKKGGIKNANDNVIETAARITLIVICFIVVLKAGVL
jgi:hypothetical protein